MPRFIAANTVSTGLSPQACQAHTATWAAWVHSGLGRVPARQASMKAASPASSAR